METVTADQLGLLEAMATERTSLLVGTNWLVDFANKESEPLRDLISKGLIQSTQSFDAQTQCLALSPLASVAFDRRNQVSQRVH